MKTHLIIICLLLLSTLCGCYMFHYKFQCKVQTSDATVSYAPVPLAGSAGIHLQVVDQKQIIWRAGAGNEITLQSDSVQLYNSRIDSLGRFDTTCASGVYRIFIGPFSLIMSDPIALPPDTITTVTLYAFDNFQNMGGGGHHIYSRRILTPALRQAVIDSFCRGVDHPLISRKVCTISSEI